MRKGAFIVILLAVSLMLPVGMVNKPNRDTEVIYEPVPAGNSVSDESIDSIIIQPNYAHGKDTFIHNTSIENPNNNYGISPELYVGTNNLEDIRSLLQFNIPTTNVYSATLSLYASQSMGVGKQNISVHPITNQWYEGIYDGVPGGANWTHRTGAEDTTTTYYDFETDDGGFVPTNDWEWGNYVWGGGSPQSVPPPSAYSGTNMWGTILTTDYNNLGDWSNLSFPVDLTDPTITSAHISWWDWYDAFETFDHGEVYVNGVLELDMATAYVPPTDWVKQIVTLDAYLGGIATVKFSLWQTTVVERAGWYIDDTTVVLNRTGLTSNPWIAPGGDYDAAEYSYMEVTAPLCWYSWNVTAVVQSWIAGTRPNRGFIMVGNDYGAGSNYIEFASSDAPNKEYRPKLIITYTIEIQPRIPNQSLNEDDPTKTVDLRYYGRGTVAKVSGQDNGWSLRPFHGGGTDMYHYQALYTSDQIGAEGVIERISFYRDNLMQFGRFDNFVISLAHTNLDEVTTTFADNYFGSLIEVFKAPQIFVNSSDGEHWFHFDLNRNFTYDSSHNLILDVQWDGDSGTTVNMAITNHSPDLRWLYALSTAALTGTTGVYTSMVTFVTDVVDCAVNDTGVDSNFWPFAPEDVPEMRCQMLYNYTEINASGIIDKIGFQAWQTSKDWAVVNNLSIRMAHSQNDSMDSNFNMHNSDPWIEVLNRSAYNFSTVGNPEWVLIDVLDLFNYNGNDNLLIEFRWIGGYGSDGMGVNLCRSNSVYFSRCTTGSYSATTGTADNQHYNFQALFLGHKQFTWSVTGSDYSLFSIDIANNNELRITPKQDAFGSGTATVTLTNSEGVQGSQTFNVEIYPVNDAPVWSGAPVEINVVEDVDYVFNASAYVTDVDDISTDLIYTTDSIYATTNDTAEIVFNYPEGVEEEYVNITVMDPLGASATVMVKVIVEMVNDPPELVGYVNTLTCHATVPYTLVLDYDDEETPVNCTIFTDSAYATVDGKNITFLYPKGLGTETVIIYLNDAQTYTTQNNVSYYLFVTIIDHPDVTANSPTGENVAVTSTISVTFDAPMNKSATEQSFKISTGGVDVAGTFSWSADNKTMSFTPTTHLNNGIYNVTVSKIAKNEAGVAMLQAFSWNFTAALGSFDGDGDGMPDQYELDNGLNPDLDDSTLDKDNDGMPNLYEYQQGFNPSVNDADADADGDGATNLDEYEAGTDPNDPADKPFEFPLMLVLLIIIILVVVVLAVVMMQRSKAKKIDSDEGQPGEMGQYEPPAEQAPEVYEPPQEPVVYEDVPPPPPPPEA